jgi:hypothetical protein
VEAGSLQGPKKGLRSEGSREKKRKTRKEREVERERERERDRERDTEREREQNPQNNVDAHVRGLLSGVWTHFGELITLIWSTQKQIEHMHSLPGLLYAAGGGALPYSLGLGMPGDIGAVCWWEGRKEKDGEKREERRMRYSSVHEV